MFMGSYQESVGSIGANEVLVPQDIKITSAPTMIAGFTLGEIALYAGGAMIVYALLREWMYSSE
jgi:hypothetical protein